jgi:hypothetical protein
MEEIMDGQIVFGNRMIPVKLPERTRFVPQGLSTYRSIRWHHSPDGMSMSIENNQMHAMLDEMGELVEEKIGPKCIFKMETALANPLQVARVWTGSVGETRRAALALLKEQYPPRRDLAEKADIIFIRNPLAGSRQ